MFHKEQFNNLVKMTTIPVDIVNSICEFVHDETRLWRPVFSPKTGLVSCWKVNPRCKKYIELAKQLIKQRHTTDILIEADPHQEWGFPVTVIAFECDGKQKIYIEYIETDENDRDDTFRAMLTIVQDTTRVHQYRMLHPTTLYCATEKHSTITYASLKWEQETNSYTRLFASIKWDENWYRDNPQPPNY